MQHDPDSETRGKCEAKLFHIDLFVNTEQSVARGPLCLPKTLRLHCPQMAQRGQCIRLFHPVPASLLIAPPGQRSIN